VHGRSTRQLTKPLSRKHAPDPGLASTLRRLRRDSGASQEHLACQAGITIAALARIERGQTNPRWTTIGRIAGALDISLAELAAAVEDAGV
jgi:transcriptional regulator with XRE-family HTH domain